MLILDRINTSSFKRPVHAWHQKLWLNQGTHCMVRNTREARGLQTISWIFNLNNFAFALVLGWEMTETTEESTNRIKADNIRLNESWKMVHVQFDGSFEAENKSCFPNVWIQSSFPGHTEPNDARNSLLCLTHDFLLQVHYFFSTWTCFGPAQSPTIVFKASPWKFLKIQKPLKVGFLVPSSFEKKHERETEQEEGIPRIKGQSRVWEEESRAKIRRDKWTKMDGFKRCRQFVSVQLIPGIYPLSLIPFLSSLKNSHLVSYKKQRMEEEEREPRREARLAPYNCIRMQRCLILWSFPKTAWKRNERYYRKEVGRCEGNAKANVPTTKQEG